MEGENNTTPAVEPEATPVEPTAAAAPTAPTEPAATPAGEAKPAMNKRTMIIIGAVVAGLLILGVIIAAVLLANRSGSNGNAGTGIDVSNPEAAVKELNASLLTAVEGIDAQDLKDLSSNPEKFFQTFVKSDTAVTSAEFDMDMEVKDKKKGGIITLSFNGAVEQTDAKKLAMEGKLTVSGTEIPDLGTISVDADMVMLADTLYIRINKLDAPNSDQLAAFALIKGNWLKLKLDQATDLAGGSGNVDTDKSLDELRDLANTWKSNPPFRNGKAAAKRTVAGQSLECMTMELNPAAFNSNSTTATELPDMELCSAQGGKTPMFTGFNLSNESSDATFGITISGVNVDKSIAAPSGEVIDLNQLMGAGR